MHFCRSCITCTFWFTTGKPWRQQGTHAMASSRSAMASLTRGEVSTSSGASSGRAF
jgi:hypothetical protein